MCKAIEEMLDETRIETRRENYVINVTNLMETLQLSLEKAMDALKVPASEREYIVSVILK